MASLTDWNLVPVVQRGDIPEAPDDGMTYARKSAAWIDVGTEIAAAATAIAELRKLLAKARTENDDLTNRMAALEAA